MDTKSILPITLDRVADTELLIAMTLDRVAIRQVLSNVIGDSRYLRVPPSLRVPLGRGYCHIAYTYDIR